MWVSRELARISGSCLQLTNVTQHKDKKYFKGKTVICRCMEPPERRIGWILAPGNVLGRVGAQSC